MSISADHLFSKQSHFDLLRTKIDRLVKFCEKKDTSRLVTLYRTNGKLCVDNIVKEKGHNSRCDHFNNLEIKLYRDPCVNVTFLKNKFV